MAIESVDQAGEELVMAIGDNGYELTPRSEIVMIRAFPVGPGNKMIPASLRHLYPQLQAQRLLGIRKAGRQYPLLTFRGMAGEKHTCCITNAAQAEDQLFNSLSARSRLRIHFAAREAGSQ